jgi:hypothetical protein
MLRYPKDLAFVLPDQLLKGCCITLPRARNQRYVWVDLFRSWGLDGGHRQKGAYFGLSLKRSAFPSLTLQP